MIPELMYTGTPIIIILGVKSLIGRTFIFCINQSIKDFGSIERLIAVKLDKFFVIPIEEPPGVSEVQKYPYCVVCKRRGPAKARPVSSEDYYGNRTVLPVTYYNNYPDYNYYNRNNNYYPTYNYQQQTPPQHNNPSPTINTPKPNVTHYHRTNEPQRDNTKPGVRR